MSKLLPIIGGISGTVIIGGTGAYLISTQKAPTIKDTFKAAIIDFDTEKELVYGKLTKLKGVKDLPANSRFKKAFDEEKKKDKQGFEEFKKACTEIYESNSIKKDSDIFKDFQSYCARTNKDKVTEAEWAPSNANWKGRFGKLKQEGKIPLSKKLIDIAAVQSTDGATLKQFCTDIEGLIFEGEEDLTFKDAKASCGKDD